MLAGLQAYFDESEEQNPRGVFVVAAAVSTTERWIAFSKAWARELKGHIFHATEWEAGKKGFGPFAWLAELSAKDQRGKERKLLWLVSTHTVRCYAQGSPGAKHLAKYAAILKIHSDPYFDMLFQCLALIHHDREAGRLPDAVVDCFFEAKASQAENRRLDRQYERMTAQWFTDGFGPAIVGRKTDPQLVPLQAADFVAHYAMREQRARVGGSHKPHKVIARLSRDGKLRGAFQTEEKYDRFLQATLNEHQKVVRGDLVLPPFPKYRDRKLKP